MEEGDCPTNAAGGQEKYLEGFGPKVDGFDQVAFDDEKALRAAITPETAALMTTLTPAQSIGNKEYGRIAVGAPAVFVRFDKDWNFKGVIE